MIYNLAWSPDGERLAWEESEGIFVVGADGSGPHARDPRWDGSILVTGRHPHRVSHLPR